MSPWEPPYIWGTLAIFFCFLVKFACSPKPFAVDGTILSCWPICFCTMPGKCLLGCFSQHKDISFFILPKPLLHLSWASPGSNYILMCWSGPSLSYSPGGPFFIPDQGHASQISSSCLQGFLLLSGSLSGLQICLQQRLIQISYQPVVSTTVH